MIWRWLAYAAALGAAIGFYIFHTGYLSWLCVVVAVALLPLELLLSARGLRAARLALAVRREGEDGDYLLELADGSRTPVCALCARVRCKNLFTGEERTARVRLAPGARASFRAAAPGWPKPDEAAAPANEDRRAAGRGKSPGCTAACCGALRFSIEKPRALDVLGLFRFPLRTAPPPALLLQRPPLPEEMPGLPPPVLQQGTLAVGVVQHPQPGALREPGDVREYRPGDAVRAIHWKLTAKLDRPMVREAGPSALSVPHLCFDFFGEPGSVCGVLGRVEALSAALGAMERMHGIHWLAEDGSLQSRYVENRDEYDAVLWELMTTRLPKTGRAIAQNLPDAHGPLLVVDAGQLSLYSEGVLLEREVTE